jgi:hypothetical protein
MDSGTKPAPVNGSSPNTNSPNTNKRKLVVTVPYDLLDVQRKLEAMFATKIEWDDPHLVGMATIDLILQQTLPHLFQQCGAWIEENALEAIREYRQGLDQAANDKKLEVRRDLIELATLIQDKLKVETDRINKPLLSRIEELKGIAETIGANYSQYRWHDRIAGFVCAVLLFLAAFAAGMVFEMTRR